MQRSTTVDEQTDDREELKSTLPCMLSTSAVRMRLHEHHGEGSDGDTSSAGECADRDQGRAIGACAGGSRARGAGCRRGGGTRPARRDPRAGGGSRRRRGSGGGNSTRRGSDLSLDIRGERASHASHSVLGRERERGEGRVVRVLGSQRLETDEAIPQSVSVPREDR